MRYVLVVLMCCLPLSVAAVLARQPVSPPSQETTAEREVDMRALRLERGEISDRITLLETRGRNFVPR